MKNDNELFKPRRLDVRLEKIKINIEKCIQHFGIPKLEKIWVVKTDESNDSLGALTYTNYLIRANNKKAVRNYIQNNFQKQAVISIQNILLDKTVLNKFIKEIYEINETTLSEDLEIEIKRFITRKSKYLILGEETHLPEGTKDEKEEEEYIDEDLNWDVCIELNEEDKNELRFGV